MTSLPDSVDRLLHIGKSIRTTAASISSSTNGNPSRTGPFTQAVLQTHLGDLIRDADPSEIGLFTLVPPAASDKDVPPAPKEMARIEVPGATPLRKPTGGRALKMREKEPEPEVYAQAALKYLDRYHSIRPMPRARSQVVSIIQDLAAVRDNIQTLMEASEQPFDADTKEPPSSPKSMITEEERRIKEIHSRMTDLKQRKEALLQKQTGTRLKKTPAKKNHPQPSTSARRPLPPKADSQEEMFWSTPAARARTLHFTESLLLDESPDLGNVTTSFASPSPVMRSRSRAASHHMVEEDELEDDDEDNEESLVDEEQVQNEQPIDYGEDVTVRLPNPPPIPASPQTPSPPPRPAEDVVTEGEGETETETPKRLHLDTNGATPASSRRPKVRITTEVERIISKIWATVGGLIKPGHGYDVSGIGSNRPPRAKETIALLQTLSEQEPDPLSPSSSSASSISSWSLIPSGRPSTQTILTAQLLLLLLFSPTLSMHYNKVKEALASKPGLNLQTGQATQRALYGCVAKRLIKIDRSTREQIVMFEI